MGNNWSESSKDTGSNPVLITTQRQTSQISDMRFDAGLGRYRNLPSF